MIVADVADLFDSAETTGPDLWGTALTKVPNQRRKFAQRFSRRADARLQPFPFRAAPPTSSYTPMCKAAERTNGVEVRPHRLLSHRNFSADRSASLFPVAAGAIHEWALLLEWQLM